ncbi:MAG TPA: hypothetical protein VMZ91_05145 [Candidatus Paceibacterota bacterium]|nr:hypothetical protein [Candidatus Paceibacterota bacterium]
MKKTSEEIAHNSKEVLDLIKTSKQGDTIIFDEREQKSSQEIMNEIEEANQEWLLDRFSSYKKDKLSLLQAQKQERLDCYKNIVEKLEKLPLARIKANSQVYQVNTLIAQLIFQFKQEIKTLEGGK